MQWGAWASVGMAAANAATLARIQRSGMGIISPLAGLSALLTAMRSPTLSQVGASILLHGVQAALCALEPAKACLQCVTKAASCLQDTQVLKPAGRLTTPACRWWPAPSSGAGFCRT